MEARLTIKDKCSLGDTYFGLLREAGAELDTLLGVVPGAVLAQDGPEERNAQAPDLTVRRQLDEDG